MSATQRVFSPPPLPFVGGVPHMGIGVGAMSPVGGLMSRRPPASARAVSPVRAMSPHVPRGDYAHPSVSSPRAPAQCQAVEAPSVRNHRQKIPVATRSTPLPPAQSHSAVPGREYQPADDLMVDTNFHFFQDVDEIVLGSLRVARACKQESFMITPHLGPSAAPTASPMGASDEEAAQGPPSQPGHAAAVESSPPKAFPVVLEHKPAQRPETRTELQRGATPLVSLESESFCHRSHQSAQRSVSPAPNVLFPCPRNGTHVVSDETHMPTFLDPSFREELANGQISLQLSSLPSEAVQASASSVAGWIMMRQQPAARFPAQRPSVVVGGDLVGSPRPLSVNMQQKSDAVREEVEDLGYMKTLTNTVASDQERQRLMLEWLLTKYT